MFDFTVYMHYYVTYILCFYATSKVQNLFPLYDWIIKLLLLLYFITKDKDLINVITHSNPQRDILHQIKQLSIVVDKVLRKEQAGFRINYLNPDIDRCVSHPCQHGGTYIGRVNRYTCTGASGYEGSTCGMGIIMCVIMYIQYYLIFIILCTLCHTYPSGQINYYIALLKCTLNY